MVDATKPDILVFYNGPFGGGLKMIEEKANVHHAPYDVPGNLSSLSLLQQFPSARAIWLLDLDIVWPQHSELSRQVVEYVKNRGGIAIICGLFSTLEVPPRRLNRWLGRSLGMPWRIRHFEDTTVHLQDSHVRLQATTRTLLAASYNCKAMFLKNVSSSDSLYASPGSARSAEMQTAVAFGKCGQGWLGYIGDIVDNEERTAEALLAMMGLLE